jgi:hypothetical protein
VVVVADVTVVVDDARTDVALVLSSSSPPHATPATHPNTTTTAIQP